MKQLLLVILALQFSILSFAEEVFVLDTLEYATVAHPEKKLEYLRKISPLLNQLNLHNEADQPIVFTDEKLEALIIHQEKWNFITAQLDSKCAEKKLKKVCKSLDRARMKLFSDVKASGAEF